MKISKTLFKNFSRCSNFAAYYDIYINRFLHEVKDIDGLQLLTQDILEDIKSYPDDLFDEGRMRLEEIYNDLFDEDTGEDLTIELSPQLEAFQDTFTEVERLAAIYVSKLFNKKVIASTNTYEQKRYEFTVDGTTFYCYLDAYLEDEETIKIFEVKATTSKKFDDMAITINKECLPLFITGHNGISRFVGDELVGTDLGGKKVSQKNVDDKKAKFFDRYSKEGKYIYDLAVERFIIENSIKKDENHNHKKVEYYLVVLNSEYRFEGIYDTYGKPVYDNDASNNPLFKIYSFDSITKEFQSTIQAEQEEILYNINNLRIKTNILDKYCEYKKTTKCKFCNICMKKVLKDGSILEYLKGRYAFKDPKAIDAKGFISIYEMVNNGYYSIDQCRDFISKNDNITQYDCYVDNTVYMDKDRIKLAIKDIKYPIYHLDFESYNCPLPRFKGEKPYDQSVFQYSLHVERSPGKCDLEKDHLEFLAKDHKDRRLELVEQLIHDIDLSKGGCVMVYNQSFEKTRLKEFADFFPKHKDAIYTIRDNIVDLLAVLKGTSTMYDSLLTPELIEAQKNKPSFTYYNNNMHGSFSIKKILPLFTNLTYKNLVVKNGSEAIVTYGKLPTLTEKEYNNMYLALRVYCRQDTWAMVEILRGLREAVK